MISLMVREIIVVSVIGTVFLIADIMVVVNWLVKSGIEDKAGWIREEFMTRTVIAAISALLILLVSPKSSGRAFTPGRRCPVCDKQLTGSPNSCSECGSNV